MSGELHFDGSRLAAHVDDRFLAVAVDASQLAGGPFWQTDGAAVAPFDFTRPRLRTLAAALSPSMLRLGGSQADQLFYDLSDTPGTAPAPYSLVLTRRMWNDADDFARSLGWPMAFTLNAGPGPRGSDRRWQPDQARALLQYARARGSWVTLWELGNEINGYQAIHGLQWRLSGREYATDFATARALLDEQWPGARLGGPSSAFWPVVGELAPVLDDFAHATTVAPDVITWHYYPQQSHRCPLRVRLAQPGLVNQPRTLDEIDAWAEAVEQARTVAAPGAQVWLGETGNAQCGGEPGVSDAWAGSLWWLDELGRVSARGQQVVVRQTLAGGDYGLLAGDTLEPRPDYWVSVLWQRLMGPGVLRPEAMADRHLRVYVHCARGDSGAAVVLFINIDASRSAQVTAPAGALYLLEADALSSTAVRLNGAELTLKEDGAVPPLVPQRFFGPTLTLAPQSAAFLKIPNAAAACL